MNFTGLALAYEGGLPVLSLAISSFHQQLYGRWVLKNWESR